MPRFPHLDTDSDLNRDIIRIITTQFESQVEKLVDGRMQRRQQWGPTFKQEDVAHLDMPDANYLVPEPEYGKRTLFFDGVLTTTRIVRLVSLPTAWWFIVNNTNQSLQFLIEPNGTVGPLVGPRQTATIITPDGVMIMRATGNVEELYNVKMLNDSADNNLFKVQFAPGDMKGAGGRVDLYLTAKTATQVAVYVKSILYVAEYHNTGALGNARWGEEAAAEEVSSAGGVTFTFKCNGSNYPTFVNPVSDGFTFSLHPVAGGMTGIPTMLLQYTIRPLGDVPTLLL